ncbi:uncharacterized protein B0H18DRAFT_1113779 [Fomitopsis serialis]|uniref:uncharacterized protein n=1 Tax=Fomitopsis serialis TaxID=139415 RepID=UPI002007E7F7|nr:uncharacterized protein B0H18DRAFT_1113779 [Neoantrodia serialis]KAH9936380.1 hypothetical protein B0H18DRAFT_1113779 [Neoantrodia serialis]
MSIRQRIPFRFSENPEDDHVLDEQGASCLARHEHNVVEPASAEQEELIESLKNQSYAAASQYMLLGQVVITLSTLLHVIYVLRWDKISPLYAVLPSRWHPAPSPPPPTAPRHHPTIALLPPTAPGSVLPPPAGPPPSHSELNRADTGAGAAAAVQLARRGLVVCPAGDVLVRLLLRSWTDQNVEEIRELERLRYDARGA